MRLVREYKGPTVDALLDAGEEDLAALPDRLSRVLEAVGEGRLDAADADLEKALGTLVAGPGHRRPRGPWRRRVFWACLLCAALLVLAAGWATELW